MRKSIAPAPLLCLLGLLLLAGCKAANTNVSIPIETEGNSPIKAASAAELETRVRAGDVQAAFELGAMYHDGIGVKKNEEKAFQLFEAAARAGERMSQFNVGMMYLKGEGTEKDYVVARRWLTQSMNGGNPRAPYQLALMYYRGLGATKDFAKAKEYFEKAALMGLPEAAFNLGIVYIRGEGTKQDFVEGYAWLAVARTYGYPSADASLKKLEEGIPDEMKKAGQARAEKLSDTIEKNKAIQKAKVGL